MPEAYRWVFTNRESPRMKSFTLAVIILSAATLAAGCETTPRATAPRATAPQSVDGRTRLVAVLPMKEGYGPNDQDTYEARIAPIIAEHGMVRDSAYTVMKFLGGSGPSAASTVGVWSLESPAGLQGVMTDPKYQANVPYRDQLHDMAHVNMYLATEEELGARPPAGHVLLVGLIAFKPGFGYQDHVDYERGISAITARHGMHLVRRFKILKVMGGAANIAAFVVWALPSPQALGAIMSDPEYVANIPIRDRAHDMAATTMYFVSQRAGQ
jgi:uncharacterized protein (DUF1330 family)